MIATAKERKRARRAVLRDLMDLGSIAAVARKYGLPRGTVGAVVSGKRYANHRFCEAVGALEKPRRPRRNWRRKCLLLRRAMERYKRAVWARAHVFQPDAQVAMIYEYKRNGEEVAVTCSTWPAFFEADMLAFEKRYADRSGMTVQRMRELGFRVIPCECDNLECEGWAIIKEDPIGSGDNYTAQNTCLRGIK